VKSLFLRIFIAFWVAMCLIVAGGIALTAHVASQRLEALENLQPGVLAADATEVLERDGRTGLERWIQATERAQPGLRILVIDQSGADLLGRPLPRRLERMVQSLARRGALEPPGRDGPRHRMHRWAPQIVGPEGDSYVLLPMPAGEPPFAVLGTHDVWFGLLVLALASSGVAAWWLARYVSRPVTRLQQSARALASGNLDARVGTAFTRRRDELGVLARDFDRMAEQLRELIALKETLLRDISHELRSPLARMRVALGLARRPGAAVDRELDRIEREAERLDELIAQILRVSRLASTDPGLRQEPCDLGALVSAVVDDVRLEAVAGDRQIDWQTPDRILVDGDADLLRSAVENVLRNAVRFSAPGSAVRVFLHQVGDRAVLHIHDAGPGVPEGELERIFEPFYRSGDARDRGSGGTGLGLSITARVLALHGGTARALNAPEGGLIVELELPLVAAARRGDSAGANRSAAR